LDGGIKKWFMLQLWRVQQVAQLLTIAMLAFTISLQIYPYVSWRFEGTVFEGTYPSITLILLLIAAGVWIFAITWDMKLRMWREQATVLVERNPYAKEKMTSKEVVLYGLIWLPLLEKMAKDDPKLTTASEVLREWLRKASKEDPSNAAEVEQLFEFLGVDKPSFMEYEEE
jgi:hypothetical protein